MHLHYNPIGWPEMKEIDLTLIEKLIRWDRAFPLNITLLHVVGYIMGVWFFLTLPRGIG